MKVLRAYLHMPVFLKLAFVEQCLMLLLVDHCKSFKKFSHVVNLDAVVLMACLLTPNKFMNACHPVLTLSIQTC